MQTSATDPVASQRAREHVEHIFRSAGKAQQTLRETDVADDEAALDMTMVIEDLNRKHEVLRNELNGLGIDMPSLAIGQTDALSTPAGAAGRRMHFERQIGDIQQACVQLRDVMDHNKYDIEEAEESSSADGAQPAGIFKGTMSTSASHIHVGNEEEEDSDEDDAQAVMTPRGVYVQRCMPMNKHDLAHEGEAYTTWLRMTRIDPLGLLIFLIYLILSIAYIASRIAFSLEGLGPQLWYGGVVLAAEMLSVLSLIFYGLWLCAKTDNSDMKVVDFDADKMRRLYTVRVFITCNDESLALVRRCIASVKNAYLPEGCDRKIYLLDNAKDKAKRDFFTSAKAGADVIYITPPVRLDKRKVVNWRSEIMNFTLSLIYPDLDDEGRKNIPASELISVVDADQTCSSSFFVTLLRYMDSGDDVAAAMCPRICFNVDPDCDIFDHQKVAYCEKIQQGMDAYGFTACSHTNMLLRARALQEIAWFPEHTLSESWELGMLLRCAGWKSRYVPEYSAIGEPPVEVCDSYDLHYRNSRGYFQSFWSYNCPLLNRDLGLFYRIMYSSRCFANFASGIWTPVFTAVPIVQLIFGYFPLTFTFEVVVTMMAYYAIRVVMLHYCDSFKQMRAMWLSRVNVSLMWWSDIKASTLVPLKVAMGPGTSFRGRSWSNAVPARNFKALRWPILFVLVSLVAFIGGLINVQDVVNLPSVLSICLVAINIVPPLLVILYWNFGAGQLMTRICSLFMLISWLAGIAAIVFLWLLYPRSVNYTRAADMSLSFLDAERSGLLPARYPVDWRLESGLQNRALITFTNDTTGVEVVEVVDLTGGFYNDGEVGPIKVTWNIALTTTMLAWSLLEYESFWARDEAMLNHAIDLLAHGTAYMQSCYQVTKLTDPTNPTMLGSSLADVLIYVVGNAEKERQLWRRPEDVTEPQYIGEVALESSPSDLAGQVTASLVSSALALRKYGIFDGSAAFSLVNMAHRLFRSAVFSPGLYTEAFNGTTTGLEDHYPSFAFGDDLFWASTWLFRASNEGIRTYNRTYYYEAMQITMDLAYADLDVPGVSWDYVNNMAVVHAATLTRDVKFHLPAQSFIWDWVCDSEQVKYTPNGRAYFYQTPYLGSTAAAAAMSALYVHKNKDWDFVKDNDALVKSLQCFATEQARYLLGGQVAGIKQHKPFMIGYNSDTYTRTWHRGASCPKWNDICDISVAYLDEPDQNVIRGAVLWNPVFTDFPQDVRGRNTTVVSLENNMAMPLLFPGVALQGVSYSECLNAQKTAFWDRAFCRQKRPADYRLGPREAIAKIDPQFQGLYRPKEEENRRIPPPPPPSPRAIVAPYK